jgi:hypothetical protein
LEVVWNPPAKRCVQKREGNVHWSSTTELAVAGCLLSRGQQLEVGRLEARVRALYEALSVVPLDERERRDALRSAIIHTEERVKRLAKAH